ncbi:hypothetical protein P0M11_06515 [Kaistella sp. PBT33-4]|uniref:hypothetical protein n=1 Tax=Kaistella sp. PBT33-4 TaxID=3032000 RepID=UPI0023D81B63|nr:hypothetical protein [Kaistella sp. PBT33-4]MDF0719651.1 hypothetical protein [Kaistella sp. PBT33-4]
MKKLVLVLFFAGLAMSCKEVQAGGNQGVLRLEKGADRYDSHENRAPLPETAVAAPVATDTLATAPESGIIGDSANVQTGQTR